MLDLTTCREWLVRLCRSMVGIPDYDTYVRQRRQSHPGARVMTYEEFFRERQASRYAVGAGKIRGCC
jgi:uncharacterized short protein YbdD (DUF466 family)